MKAMKSKKAKEVVAKVSVYQLLRNKYLEEVRESWELYYQRRRRVRKPPMKTAAGAKTPMKKTGANK